MSGGRVYMVTYISFTRRSHSWTCAGVNGFALRAQRSLFDFLSLLTWTSNSTQTQSFSTKNIVTYQVLKESWLEQWTWTKFFQPNRWLKTFWAMCLRGWAECKWHIDRLASREAAPIDQVKVKARMRLTTWTLTSGALTLAWSQKTAL